MSKTKQINYIDNTVATTRPEYFICITVDTNKVIKSWKESLHSFEWLLPDGRIKDLTELPENEQPKRINAEQKIETSAAFEKPVLGIGIMDNIEIGSGRADFLTIAAHGVKEIQVHIPKSNENDFKDFIV